MRPPHPLLALLLCAGCTDETSPPCAEGYGRVASGTCVLVGQAEPSDTEDPEDTGACHIAPDLPAWEVPPAVWSAAEVEEELAAMLGQGVPDPFTIFTGWQSMFVGSDAICPGGDGYDITSSAFGCVSESGWLYAGMGSYEELEEDGEQIIWLSADGYVISPDSGTLVGGGTIFQAVATGTAEPAWRVEMEGTFGLDTSPSVWFSQTPGMAIYAVGAARGDLSFFGGWQMGGQAIYMNIAVASSCEGATGTLKLQDPSGEWHAVVLDCGDCGDLRYADGPVAGELCVDLTPIQAFIATMETAP